MPVQKPTSTPPAPTPTPKPPAQAEPPKATSENLASLMEEKRTEIARRQSFLDKAKAELDSLIQQHNLVK